MIRSETIAAIASPAGEGAISVIRISGGDAFACTQKMFSGCLAKYASHTAHYGRVVNQDGKTIDTVLLLIMRAPKSYTGEDSIELFCHGGSLITRRVIERVFETGVRPARPGEFSLRAYMNGKIDLAQAEAVQQLIAAKNELALNAAEKQLKGDLSEKIRAFQKELTDLAAILEAWVDFPEEGLEFTTIEDLSRQLQGLCDAMQNLARTYHHGAMLNTGILLSLVGSPNVGKSSLMNALLGKERAIVTPIAGTTRDVLEEDLRLGALHFRLIDTAGIRHTEEIVEQMGIERSKAMIQEADIVLLLVDAERGMTSDDWTLLQKVPPSKTVLVWNKTDVRRPATAVQWPVQVEISAKERLGLDDLQSAIENLVWKQGAPSKEEITITHLRHKESLEEAVRNCQKVIEALHTHVSAEFVTSDLRAALHALSQIIGANVSEDILSAIFSRFCLGK